MNNYQFNDLGVCLNPDVLDFSYKSVTAQVRFFSHKGLFGFAIDYQTPYSGHSFAPSLSKATKNVEKGLYEIIDYLSISLDRTLKDTSSCKPAYLNAEVATCKTRLVKKVRLLKHSYNLDLYAYLKRSERNFKQGSLF